MVGYIPWTCGLFQYMFIEVHVFSNDSMSKTVSVSQVTAGISWLHDNSNLDEQKMNVASLFSTFIPCTSFKNENGVGGSSPG